MALDPTAAQAADDEFYPLHPDLVKDGRREPLNSGMPRYTQLRAEWQKFYDAHVSRSSGGPSEVRPAAREPYITRITKPVPTTPLQDALKSHAFVVRSCRLMVAPPDQAPGPSVLVLDQMEWHWPLAGYYVYLDTQFGGAINFDTLGLLWTDEKGILHRTSGDGKPIQPLSHFVLAWSTDDPDSFISAVLIYDQDRGRLEKRKRKVQQAAKRSALANKYRIAPLGMLIDLSNSDQGALLSIIVPRDDEVLDVGRLKALMEKCNKDVQAAHAAQKRIVDFVNGVGTSHDDAVERQVMYFYREQINSWLGLGGSERRRHLSKVNPNNTRWDLECSMFDHDLQGLLNAYDRSLDPLYAILTDDAQRQDIGDIGLVLEGWDDPGGEHLLWRHQFLTEACSLFCDTPRQNKIFTKIVQPLFQGLSNPWSDLRVACKCATCKSMIKDETTSAKQPLKDLLHYTGWRSRDLKMGASSAARLVDLFTKLGPNWAHVLATAPSADAFRDAGLISWWFFIRAGLITKVEGTPQLAEKWLTLWGNMVKAARKAEGTLEEFAKDTLGFLHLNLKKGTADILSRVGDAFNLVGAGIVVYSVVTKEGTLNRKDAADLGRAITDSARAAMGFGKKRLEAALIKELGEEAGKKWAAALPKYFGVAGGCFQVASAFYSLQEAADSGDSRTWGWAVVTYTGADISMAGLVLDAAPEPVVTKGSGLVLNFVGGVVYLVGQVGSFATKPGMEEAFLRSHLFYEDAEHWMPGEKGAWDWNQAKATGQFPPGEKD